MHCSTIVGEGRGLAVEKFYPVFQLGTMSPGTLLPGETNKVRSHTMTQNKG